MAWMLEQKRKCGGCGTFDWQWPDEGRGSMLEADGDICFGCEAIQTEQARRLEGAIQPGLRIGLFHKEVSDG